MKQKSNGIFLVFSLTLLSLLSGCRPPIDEYKEFLDGPWIVEEIILNDPLGKFSDNEALNLDQEKSKFYFDYSGSVRTPMGKRKFRFKEGHEILVIGDFQYLFSKIDDDRFKIHLVKDQGAAEIIYILRRITDEEYKKKK